MTKILIPLAVAFIESGSRVPVHFVRETYVQKLLRYGLTPVCVPGPASEEMLRELYDECGGVLLVGGTDVDPARFGKEPHATTRIEDGRREKTEFILAEWSTRDKKPILGICRGCQVLAVAHGGSLIAHLPEAVPQEDHGVSEGGTYDSLSLPGQGHPVDLAPDSRAVKIVGKTSIHATSGHHQAVENPGRDIIVSGRTPAGVAEVIEHADPSYWCFGIQSHPEAEDSGDLEPLLASFAEAAKGFVALKK